LIRVIVSDLDGTLLDENHQVSSFSLNTLRSLIAKGYHFVIATGRHYHDVAYIARNLGGGINLISSNGAQVHDGDGNLKHDQTLPLDVVNQAIAISRSYDLHRNLYRATDWLAEEENERLLAHHQQSQFCYRVTRFVDEDLSAVSKLLFIGDPNDLADFKAELVVRLGDCVNIVSSKDDLLEIMHKNVSKGRALKEVLGRLESHASHVMAFGDAMNDADMLDLVGHPVVMENAQSALKTHLSEFKLASTNYQDGVAHYLIDYGLADNPAAEI
jgi:Cof subfamily protein (haloacid dehalogenase superfamily)